ncbi:MAG: HU family DNA-binding protein [Prevotella sp.]|jgi:nucleoid DNA-binding protein|nr:HU family DNA-binding protein [Prevotella sp.]
MAKNSLSLLSERLVEKNHLDEATADEFIKSLLAVISTGLQQDKLVKVKGWGTLKIISVRDRESIDVNTGERIVIEGRDKLSFTPDAVLREIVNKPFAQFETVIVNDGVDFTPIDEKFAEGMVPEAGEEEEVTTFQTVPVSVTEGQQEEQKDIEKEPLVPSIEKEKDTVEQGEETKLTDLHKPAGQLPATADTTESVPLSSSSRKLAWRFSGPHDR